MLRLIIALHDFNVTCVYVVVCMWFCAL